MYIINGISHAVGLSCECTNTTVAGRRGGSMPGNLGKLGLLPLAAEAVEHVGRKATCQPATAKKGRPCDNCIQRVFAAHMDASRPSQLDCFAAEGNDNGSNTSE